MKNNKVEVGHRLAYLVWDTNNMEELYHLYDVFHSCMKIRREQFRIHDLVKKDCDLNVEHVLLEEQ